MARIVAYVPDLLFGSNVAGAMQAAGHECRLLGHVDPAEFLGAEVLIIDLTADPEQRLAAVQPVLGPALKTLAFYSHVEVDVRADAEEAGIDLVVPRSRMAREGASLVASLLR